MSTPPYASGTFVPSRPSAPHFLISSRLSAQSFCSSRSTSGSTSPSMNSPTVCPISTCSSVSRSGVITADGSVSSISHAPPFIAVSVVAPTETPFVSSKFKSSRVQSWSSKLEFKVDSARLKLRS